jgi:S-adenosylmethionine hydrolase
MGYIVFQTDFGGHSSGSMAGVCRIVDPSLKIFELTHSVPKFDVETAGKNLVEVIPFWPAGTVFVSVVDPGVGTPRKACAAKTKSGHYIVTPDNGILDIVNRELEIESVHEIDQSVNRFEGNHWSEESEIFHGRDVFAYTGAKLASGKIDIDGAGPEYPVTEIVSYEK